MHSETTDSYRRVSFCLLMVLSLGRKSSYPASDCCQLTRYDLLNEREIAKALIDNDITSHMPTFYEQVTGVKVLFFVFLHRAFAFVVALVSLLSTVFLFALLMSCLHASSVPVGVREESRCCHLSVGLEGRSRLAVIGTRCRRNG